MKAPAFSNVHVISRQRPVPSHYKGWVSTQPFLSVSTAPRVHPAQTCGEERTLPSLELLDL